MWMPERGQDHDEDGRATTIAMSATLPTNQSAYAMKSTTCAAREPGLPDQPVDQVAERAAEQQAERDRPRRATRSGGWPGRRRR